MEERENDVSYVASNVKETGMVSHSSAYPRYMFDTQKHRGFGPLSVYGLVVGVGGANAISFRAGQGRRCPQLPEIL